MGLSIAVREELWANQMACQESLTQATTVTSQRGITSRDSKVPVSPLEDLRLVPSVAKEILKKPIRSLKQLLEPQLKAHSVNDRYLGNIAITLFLTSSSALTRRLKLKARFLVENATPRPTQLCLPKTWQLSQSKEVKSRWLVLPT